VNADDFPLILDQGDVASLPRWKTPLRGGLRGLPPVGTGRRLLVIDDRGKAHPYDNETAGARQWRDVRSWMVIDVGAHALGFGVHVDSPFGHVGFDAWIDVECRVTDPVVVAEDRIDGVRDRLASAMRTAARRVVRKAATAPRPSADNAAQQLLADRLHLSELLEDELQTELGIVVPGWLSTTVTSVDVKFDQRTLEDYEELRRLVQEGHVTHAGEDLLDIKRDRMTPHLTGDSRTLLVELLLRDQSGAHFATIVEKLNQLNAEDRIYEAERGLEFIRNGHLDDYPELADEMAEHLRGIITNGRSSPPLKAADAKPALPAENDPGTVDHEGTPKTEEHRPDGGDT
jgi:uncharacterized protein YdcH (DUF465 family)